jgi:hypothetical protein
MSDEDKDAVNAAIYQAIVDGSEETLAGFFNTPGEPFKGDVLWQNEVDRRITSINLRLMDEFARCPIFCRLI